MDIGHAGVIAIGDWHTTLTVVVCLVLTCTIPSATHFYTGKTGIASMRGGGGGKCVLHAILLF